jgi:hypothetical protein
MLVRQRQEIQEMPRAGQLVLSLLPMAVWAASLPEQFAGAPRGAVRAGASLVPAPVLAELGSPDGSCADYAARQVCHWRTKDATGAYALAFWLQAEGLQSVSLGNSVLTIKGEPLSAATVSAALQQMPGLRQQALPAIAPWMPAGADASSLRFVPGPATLAALMPELRADAAGFALSAEGQFARYGTARLLLLRFPNQLVARQQLAQIQQTPGAQVKRSGPLVAVLMDAADGSLLKKIEYKSEIVQNEANPDKPVQDTIEFLVSVFLLISIIVVSCLGAGIGYAAYRQWRQRSGREESATQQLGLK